jgi:hypothetical protein
MGLFDIFKKHNEPAPAAEPTITVIADSFEGGGATIYEGVETPEVQALIDEQLRTGQAVVVDFRRSTGTGGSQFLPSYCKNGWPHCLDCDCRE